MKTQFLCFTFFLLMCLTLPLTTTAQVVDIPDPNLRFAIEIALGKTSGATITVEDMAKLSNLDAPDSNISDLTGLEHATNLTELQLWINSISDISALVSLTNLAELYLSSNSISDISALAGLTSLTQLGLGGNSISDISALAGLTNLAGLGLGNNSISDISALAGLTELVELYLSNNSISDISALAGLTNLEWLSLGNNNISDISPLVQNTGLGQGDTVDVVGNPLNATSINTHIPILQRKGVKVLHPLNIPDPNLRSAIENALGKTSGATITVEDMERLTFLDASDSNIGDLTGLEFATNLAELDLSNNNISDISALAGLTNLGTWLDDLERKGILYLSNNNISDISALAGLSELYRLDLPDNSISDISALVDLTELSELDLSNNSISDISALAGLSELAELDLSNNSISDISPLMLNKALDYISVFGNPLSGTSLNTYIPTLRNRGITGLLGSKLFLSVINSVAVGETFTLNLIVNAVSDLAGWQLNIAFNPAALTAISVNEGDFLSQDGGNTFFQAGSINNLAGSITDISGAVIGTGGVSGTGTLFSINFEAKAVGEGALQLSEGRLGASNGNQIHYETVIHPVTVAVIVEPNYDLNGDGKVNVLDLMLVAQNLGGANPQADVNDDGTVDVFDLIAVAQHSDSAPQAPSGLAYQRSVPHSAMIQTWIDMAHAADDGSLTFQLGIANLERLLAALLPDKTALLANYPNPFNPETWIPYHLANDAAVTLTIYDIKGAVVRLLDLGHQRAGYYTDRSRAAC